jgi:hypothetical protein
MSRPATSLALLIIAGALTTPVAAQQPSTFEGVITMNMTSEEGTKPIQYYVRKGMARMDVGEGDNGGVMLMDGKTPKMLMPSQKMYMEMGMFANMGGGENSKGPQHEIVRTGKKETVAGWECEHILIKDPAGESDVCAAKGLGTFMFMGGGMGGPGRGGPPRGGPGWQRDLMKDGFFPLKVSTKGKTEIEVTKIEKKSLDASLFEVPKDYTKMVMPGMGRP